MASEGPSEPLKLEITLHEMRVDVEKVQQLVAAALQERGYDADAMFAMRLCLEEALVNGFRHGNKGNPEKSVTVWCAIDPAGIELEVIDEGEGFDPGSVPDPTAEENIEIPSGRGIMLMRAYMTSVEYLPPGNRLRIVYRKPEAQQ